MLQKLCKVWRLKRAKILHALTSSTAEILHGMASNDAEILQGLTSRAAEILHSFTSSAAEILHALTSSAAGILHALTSSAAEILHGPQQQKFCRQWNPELKKFYVLQGQCCRNSESLLFHSQKRQIIGGPTHTNSFDQFSFLCFFYFSVIIVEITILCMLMFFFLFSPTPPPTPTVHSNCKSKMAGRTNDRELLALARTNKTPALQARAQLGAAKRKSQTTTFLSEVFTPSNPLRIWHSPVSTNLINLKASLILSPAR